MHARKSDVERYNTEKAFKLEFTLFTHFSFSDFFVGLADCSLESLRSWGSDSWRSEALTPPLNHM